VVPIPDEVARALVAAEAPSLLPSLSASPVAAASLCSVYKAEVDGAPVAVKVRWLWPLRPREPAREGTLALPRAGL
jgi:hypothetical protein